MEYMNKMQEVLDIQLKLEIFQNLTGNKKKTPKKEVVAPTSINEKVPLS